jgi:hypothetical protein
MEMFFPVDCARLPIEFVAEAQIEFNQNLNDWGDDAIEVFEFFPEHIQIVSEIELIESELELL